MSDSIAKTIIAQLPRNAFRMMGAKDLMDHGNGLSFRVGRNAKKVTHVHITLEPSDVYSVVFYAKRGIKCRTVSEVHMVYADGLGAALEGHTGMYLTL